MTDILACGLRSHQDGRRVITPPLCPLGRGFALSSILLAMDFHLLNPQSSLEELLTWEEQLLNGCACSPGA